jgi:hypothetical protein
MSIEVKFTMERPDTSTDFWWESSNTEIADIRQTLDILATNQNIQRTSNKSDNGLIYESRFLASDLDSWAQFMNAVIIELPNMIEYRNSYLAAAGHTIHMVINNIETNAIITETTSPTWTLAN